MSINNIKFMPKFTPKEPKEEPRYRIEHLETTGWVVCENSSNLTKAQCSQRFQDLQRDGLNPNQLRFRKENG